MNNLLTTPLTMSSREIADLTGKQHKNVVRDVEKMVTDCNLTGSDLSRLAGTYTDAKGERRKCYNLPKNLTITLIAGYRADLRLKIVDRWMELEAQPAIVQETPEQLALRAMQALQATVEQQKAQIATMQEDVSALDRIARADGSLCITEAAKALQMRPKELFDYLSRHGWIYRRPGGKTWLGYAYRTNTGDLEHKVHTALRADGSEKVCERVLITAQGLRKLARLLPSRLRVVA